MPYDEKGRPILDGKSVDPDEEQMDAVMAGFKADGHALTAAMNARIKARADKAAADKKAKSTEIHPPKSPPSKP
jgi:hypothetical protein